MTPRPLLPALCLAAAFTLAAGAHADDGRRQGRGNGPGAQSAEAPRMRAARHDALADSVRRVQSRTGGQVLSAERVPFDGRDINRVKVVDERGRVRVYMDDPASRRPPRPTRGDDD
ncbi:hypothetical protein [Luteimonas granuli]|nr:hypothetical protein [Luteimonas granuli]